MSERTERLRQESLAAVPSITGERAEIITAFYKEHVGKYSVPVLRALNFLAIVRAEGALAGRRRAHRGRAGPRAQGRAHLPGAHLPQRRGPAHPGLPRR